MKKLTTILVLSGLLLDLRAANFTATGVGTCTTYGVIELSWTSVEYGYEGVVDVDFGSAFGPGSVVTVPIGRPGHTLQSVFNPYTGQTFYADPSGNISVNANTCTGAETQTTNSTSINTNYVLTAVNTLSNSAQATITWDGTNISSTVLGPGQSVSVTSPTVLASSTNSVSITVTPITGGTSTGAGNDGQPIITFNNSGGGSTAGTFTANNGGVSGGGGSGSGNAVTVTGTNTPYVPPNTITFTPSTGNPAQEPTLQAGINAAHVDSQNLLNGLTALNTTLQTQTAFITNGDGVIQMLQRSNNDALWQVVKAITNAPIASGSTNIIEFPTNLLASIASNVDYLANVTNGEPGLETNVETGTYAVAASDTNSDAAVTLAQNSLGSDLLNTANGLSNSIATSLGQTVPTGDSMPNMTFTLGSGVVSQTIDFNPMDEPKLSWIFIFTHAFLSWVLYVWFVRGVLQVVRDVLSDMAAAQTTGVPNMGGGSTGSTNKPAKQI